MQLTPQLESLHSQMDHPNAWETNSQVEDVMAHRKLDPESNFEQLSGGYRREAFENVSAL